MCKCKDRYSKDALSYAVGIQLLLRVSTDLAPTTSDVFNLTSTISGASNTTEFLQFSQRDSLLAYSGLNNPLVQYTALTPGVGEATTYTVTCPTGTLTLSSTAAEADLYNTTAATVLAWYACVPSTPHVDTLRPTRSLYPTVHNVVELYATLLTR